MQIDVFNGDADGICALVQLRLAMPTKSQLITGIKRDIELLDRVKVNQDDNVTVLDISLQKNHNALTKILEQGAYIFYIDHHQAGTIPTHKNLRTRINTNTNMCTGLLVNDYLQGKYKAWAVTAAFGDNLLASAKQTALPLSLSTKQLQQLQTLGTCINYNSYGASLKDLHFAPDILYKKLQPYTSPFDFIADNNNIFEKLVDGYNADINSAKNIVAEYKTKKIAVYILPDKSWARRINGVFNNNLTNNNHNRAHAVVSINNKKGYQISVRAPLNNKTGADKLCSLFPTGGGRKIAAGINHLTIKNLPKFIDLFEKAYK